jgi:hypothetical protein
MRIKMINEFNYLPLEELHSIRTKYSKHLHPAQKYKVTWATYRAKKILNKALAKKFKLSLKETKNQEIKLVNADTNLVVKRDEIINAILNEIALCTRE